MPYRSYEYCKNCKHQNIPTDKPIYGFGIRKEGGCLFPLHGEALSVRCTGFEEK